MIEANKEDMRTRNKIMSNKFRLVIKNLWMMSQIFLAIFSFMIITDIFKRTQSSTFHKRIKNKEMVLC